MIRLQRTLPLPLLLLSGSLAAQGEGPISNDDVHERLDRLEGENVELRRRVDLLAGEQREYDFRGLVPPMGEGQKGFGPAASKVYAVEEGISIGGYGEGLYQSFAGNGALDTADFLRAVLYFGYRFDENWVFNSEIEFEHASTGQNGEASVEFAYLDYACGDTCGVRAGLLLIPMGFLNELHEPQTFLGATRPVTESRILPSTWREMGIGVYGDAGPISYRAYVVNGLDGMGFSDAGLRGGRQKGSQALAEDLALVARADWTDTPGVLAGGSVYHGGSGQGQAGLATTKTTILEAHGEYRSRGVWARGLYAMAYVDDVAQLNAARMAANPMLVPADSVGEELSGGYLELGYDVLSTLPDEKGREGASLSPFVRWETIDTQAEVPAGFNTRVRNDTDIATVGLAYQPFDSVVFKLEYQDHRDGLDRVNVALGYAF